MKDKDLGRSPCGDGLSQAEPVSAVSALRASIPSAEAIPTGFYCYDSLSPMNEHGQMHINGKCPFWESRPGEHAYCRFLGYHTEFERELLWDQVKVCGVRDHE